MGGFVNVPNLGSETNLRSSATARPIDRTTKPATRARRIGFLGSTALVSMLVFVPSTCCVQEVTHPQSAIAPTGQFPRVHVSASLSAGIDRSFRDPQALLRAARQKYGTDVRAYECTFWRQDRLGGRLIARQQIEVLYRESPRTILMTWVKNVRQVKRALYEAGRQINAKGEACALIEPTNPVVRLCASKVAIPIHGRHARQSSRHPIDRFGFGATLDRIDRVNAMASARGDLVLRYTGIGSVDGRPTHIIERRLPYTGERGEYPDAVLVLQLDQEWLLPVSIHSYADQNGEELLGSYVFTNVKFHREIDDELFEF